MSPQQAEKCSDGTEPHRDNDTAKAPSSPEPVKERPPLWAWPIGLWLVLLVPTIPLALYTLLFKGPGELGVIVQSELLLGGVALLLSALLALISWVVCLVRR